MKRKHITQQEKSINQLIDIIGHSDEYKEFIKKDKEYREYLEYNKKIKLWSIIFFDVYNNKQFNKLLRKIDRLNDKKFEVEMNLRVNKKRDLNYMRLHYKGSFTASLGKVVFTKDDFFNRINLSYTQINNNQIIVEFEMWLKNFEEQKGLLFIENNKNTSKGKPYIRWYNFEKTIKDGHYGEIHRIYGELLIGSLQTKLDSLLMLNYGRLYNLPYCEMLNYPEESFVKEDMRDVFLSKSFEIGDGEQYLIIDLTSHEGKEMCLCFSGDSCKPMHFIGLFSRFQMEFYYYLFSGIEDMELNERMNKYFCNSKKRIRHKDYKWLVNKIRGINDNVLVRNIKEKKENLISDWKAFYGGEEAEIDFLEKEYTNRYKEIYSQCIDYVKVLFSLQKDRLVIAIASLTLLATVIGICVTIIMSKYSTYILFNNIKDFFQNIIN